MKANSKRCDGKAFTCEVNSVHNSQYPILSEIRIRLWWSRIEQRKTPCALCMCVLLGCYSIQNRLRICWDHIGIENNRNIQYFSTMNKPKPCRSVSIAACLQISDLIRQFLRKRQKCPKPFVNSSGKNEMRERVE